MIRKRKIISLISIILFIILSAGGWVLWWHVIPRKEKIEDLQVWENDNEYLPYQETTISDGEDIKISPTSYESSNMKIVIETVTEEDLVYYIADVIITDSALFRTAFANDEFGRNINEDAMTLASSNNAILALNGDYYGWRDDGIIIRNGTLYRNKGVRDMLAIYNDGTMKILNEKDYSSDQKIIQLLEDGVIHTFSYGPALISNGEKISNLDNFRGYLSKKHPRTAIGMIEPYHFVFVVVDGRIEESEGVDLDTLADIMEGLGCTEAYNFDGGASSIMIFNGIKINKLETRELSDIIYFAEP